MTIISKIERSHESSEHQHGHLLLKFLSQLQIKMLFAKVYTFF